MHLAKMMAELRSPIGKRRYSRDLVLICIADRSLSLGSFRGIWKNPFSASSLLKYLHPARTSVTASTLGRGQCKGVVIALTFRKSDTKRGSSGSLTRGTKIEGDDQGETVGPRIP